MSLFEVQVALKPRRRPAGGSEPDGGRVEGPRPEAQLGSQRWKLQSASEQVDALVAQLKARQANLRTQEATLDADPG